MVVMFPETQLKNALALTQRADGVCRYLALRQSISAMYQLRSQKSPSLQTFQYWILQCRCIKNLKRV